MIDRRNISNLYPLSSLQEGMLYHALREPASRAYFEQIDFQVPGALDTEAYKQAWQDLVKRHDILRTVFAVRKLPQPLQIVLRDAPLTWVHEDLSALPNDAAEARIAAYRNDDLAQGFDLTAAVPMRLALFTLAGAQQRVVWSFHHILLDGWSLAILQSELDALYAARLAGRSASLPPPAPFSTYIKWLGKRDRKEGLAFWQVRLQGLTLPTPVPRRLDVRFLQDNPVHDAGECRHPLGAAAKEALARLAAAHGVTVNIVVQCLWGMLLGRMSGRRDAAFAATVSGRPAELENAGRTVGIFINAVPVRIRLQPGESLAALLARVHAESIEAQAYHDCPLAEVQAAHPLRDALFDHILVFENYPQQDKPPQPSQPSASDAMHLHEYTHYNFEFQFLPGDPPVLRFRFNRNLFDPASIARIGPDFEALLMEAHADPQRPADQLALPRGKWNAPARLAIAASFTAEPIADALSWWLGQFACAMEVDLAPYNQCVQQLADPDSVLRQADLGVLLLRFEDAARDLTSLSAEEARARLDAQCEMLLSLLGQRGGKPLIIGLLPAATSATTAHVQQLEHRWRQALQALPDIVLLDLRNLAARHGLDEVFDPAADRIGHLPYSPQAFDAIAADIARAAIARARPPFKAIAVDCDNTLWSGVVGEAGPLGVRIDEGHRALQQFLLDRQQQGFLITLASKNQESDVWAVFDRNPDMLLRREHIAAVAINWQPKSGNLRQLAARLNLGVDSFIFIDDSPLECSEVMENCPEALAIPLPADPALYADWLARVWAFDATTVTAEDRARTGMMQAESQRQAMLGAADPQAFLEQLQLTIKVGPVQPHQVARVAQLTQRTNQFNLSGRRRDEADIAALMATPGISVLAVEADDRFGAYGLTGVAIVRSESDVLCLDTLLLSCRVLGRKVEHALLSALARRALALGHKSVAAQLIVTDRNEPVQLFLRQPPWQPGHGDHFSCDAQTASAPVSGVELLDDYLFLPDVVTAPGHAVVTPPEADQPAMTPARQWPAFPLPIRNETQLRHGAQYLPLLIACAGWPRVRLRPARPGIAPTAGGRQPAAGAEKEIAAIWAEVLGCEIADAESSFTELGGHSLHAVRAVSRLERKFNRVIGLSQFFSLGSIAALAAWLDAQLASAPATAMQEIPRAADAPDYPLSHNQQRLWILSRMGAADNTYNLCAAFRLRGVLNAAALRHAVQQVVRRHEALRTVFRLSGDQPRQVILNTPADSFTVFAEMAGRREEAVRAHIAERSRMSFDLENGPLFRVELHSLHSDDQVLAIYLHHIIGDGWSFGLLLNDLARAYARETGATAGEDRTAALRYRDYASWNRSAQRDASLARHRDYWRQQFQALAPIAQLPLDFPRPPIPGGEGGSLVRMLPMRLPQLQGWLAQHQANLFPMLASLVALLLYRCGNESTIRLGMPVAGRDRPELEQTVGFFANTTVLTAQLQAGDSFASLLNAMQQRVTGALEHQAWPFDRLVAELQPEREPGRNPLFDVMVVLQNARGESAGLAGIDVQDFPVDTGLAAFDLVFEFAETGDGQLACALRYRRDLYREDTANRLLDRFTTLFNSALAVPSASLHELALVGAAEQAQLAAYASGGFASIPVVTLPELFARQAAATPDALAVAAGDAHLDYRTLDRRANALARRLREVGNEAGHITEGDVVAVMLDRNADWPVAMLGILKAGAVYLPLDPRHPPARLRDLLRQSGAKVLIAALSDHASFADADARLLAPSEPDAVADTSPAVAISGTSGAYLIFTSGSTGVPKGVRVHHRAFVNMILEQVRGFAIEPRDVILHLASCAFDASLSEFFMAWMCGAGVAIADHESARDGTRLRRLIEKHHATVATFTPSHLRQLEDAEIAGLRKVILAAEAVLGRDARRLQALGIDCFNAYGPTETAVCATLTRIGEVADDAAPVPIGRPLANLRLHIVDSTGQDVPLGVPGEILVLGEGVALGYLNMPDSTAFFSLPDGTRGYRTGDIGRWRADGQVEYLGRKDTQLKIRGHRVEPGEIAAALIALDGIRQAEVVPETNEAGVFLAAYLCGVRQPDATLRARLGDSLPSHMMPARFVWLEQMPLTTSGKLDRSALPALAALSALPQRHADAPSPLNDTETMLLEIWRKLLPGEVDADTDFFAAGGNSLLAMSAARRITQRLGCACPALQFFRTPTVRSMAAAFKTSEAAPSIQTFGSGEMPIFALPPHPGLDLGYPMLARALPEASIHAAGFVDKPIGELIEDYLAVFERMDNRQGAVLLGYSAGGKLALALAHALECAGRTVRAVVLIDTWSWAQASPATHARINAEMTAMLAQDTPLAAAYRTRMAVFEPAQPVRAPIHHLQAGESADAVPSGLSRDWRRLAEGSYREYRLSGMHHQLLDAAHMPHTAAVLRTLVQENWLPEASLQHSS